MAFPIVVPPHQRAAIEELTSLSEDAYKAVYERLASAGPLAEPTALIEQTSKALSDYTKFGGQVLGMVIGLRSLVDRSAMAQTNVVDAVATDVVGKKWIAQESRDCFVARLSELLGMRAVAISSKAFSLAVADNSPFDDIRIISDVRPIFSEEASQLDFSGALIVHHMVIGVSGQGDDLFCTLTTADLLKVKKAVDRALEKDKKLRSVLRGSPISPLEAAQDSDEKEL